MEGVESVDGVEGVKGVGGAGGGGLTASASSLTMSKYRWNSRSVSPTFSLSPSLYLYHMNI